MNTEIPLPGTKVFSDKKICLFSVTLSRPDTVAFLNWLEDRRVVFDVKKPPAIIAPEERQLELFDQSQKSGQKSDECRSCDSLADSQQIMMSCIQKLE